MSMIPDPTNPTGAAIDADTGGLAPSVRFIPRDRFANPDAPTMAELEAIASDPSTHIGWATTRQRCTLALCGTACSCAGANPTHPTEPEASS